VNRGPAHFCAEVTAAMSHVFPIAPLPTFGTKPKDPERKAAPGRLESSEQEKAAAKLENQGGWMGPVPDLLKIII